MDAGRIPIKPWGKSKNNYHATKFFDDHKKEIEELSLILKIPLKLFEIAFKEQAISTSVTKEQKKQRSRLNSLFGKKDFEGILQLCNNDEFHFLSGENITDPGRLAIRQIAYIVKSKNEFDDLNIYLQTDEGVQMVEKFNNVFKNYHLPL